MRWRICQMVVLLALGAGLSACASQNRPLQLIAGAGPVYPAAARAAGIEGEVTLQYDVTAQGQVTNISVVASHPPDVFDEAARQALQSWQFNAARQAGQPVASRKRRSTITFRLGTASEYDKY